MLLRMEFGVLTGGSEIHLMYILPEDCGKIRLNFEIMELFASIIGNKSCNNYEKRVAIAGCFCYNGPVQFTLEGACADHDTRFEPCSGNGDDA